MLAATQRASLCGKRIESSNKVGGRRVGVAGRVRARRATIRAAVADESELEARMREVMQMDADAKIEKEESTMRQTEMWRL